MDAIRLRRAAPPAIGARIATLPVRLLLRVSNAVLGWQSRARDRYHLAALDDHMLRDMGLTRLDADREFRKPFWRD